MSESAKKPISRKRKILYWIIGFIAVCWVIASFGESETPNQTPTPVPVQELTATFDVPSLVGKNVDEVRAVLGAPKGDDEPTALQLEGGIDEWEKLFEKDGHTLLVTYKSQTRAVVDFFIPTNDPSGVTKDKAALLRTGNLQEGDSHYRLEFVQKRSDPSRYTGVKIIPL